MGRDGNRNGNGNGNGDLVMETRRIGLDWLQLCRVSVGAGMGTGTGAGGSRDRHRHRHIERHRGHRRWWRESISPSALLT